jgi:hypothetical protein
MKRNIQAFRATGFFFPLLLVLLTACASAPKAYLPVDTGVTGVPPKESAVFEIPETFPKGELDIRALGFGKLAASEDTTPSRTLGIRMTLSNNSGTTTWILNPISEKLGLIGQGASEPVFIKTNGVITGIKPVRVEPHEKRIVDLFYTLPSNTSPDTTPAFFVLWEVVTSEGVTKGRTEFASRLIQRDQ